MKLHAAGEILRQIRGGSRDDKGATGPMLLSFRVANHRSLRDEQQLLLTPAYAVDPSEHGSWQGLTVAGIFGANASGKSNVIDALGYMSSMVSGSFRFSEPGAGIRRHPFALDQAMREEPSVYAVDLLLSGVRYTYGFSVDDSKVVEEWLHSYPHKRRRTVFHRRMDDYSYGESTPESLRQAEQLTEPNVLFLSVAARARQELLRPVYAWLADVSLLMREAERGRFGRVDVGAHPMLRRPGNLDRLTSLLRAADTGIEEVKLVEPEEDYAAREARRGGRTKRIKYLRFRHRGAQEILLGMPEQSLGTRALYELGILAFTALDEALTLVLDELDSSLHPYLTAQIIRLFRDPETNPHGAQLIFTSHDVSLLGRIQGEEILQRDQIWFTEKDESGATELFPLSDFKPRKDENRERRYLAGRYGAVPVVNDELFAAALTARSTPGDGHVSADS